MKLYSYLYPENTPPAAIIIRVMTGAVFLSEGIQKFLLPQELGVGRFTKIGIPSPELLAPFVACVEIAGGILLLMGLLTRIASLPLLVTMAVAIYTTKLSVIHDFWKLAHEARTDYCMIMGLLFLAVAGSGPWSVDKLMFSNRKDRQ